MRIIYLTHLKNEDYVKRKYNKYILNKNSKINVFKFY